MKIVRQLMIAAWILTNALIINCSDKNAIDFGTFEAGRYSNSFFDLMLNIPNSWHVLDLELRLEIMKRGGEIVAGGNKSLKAAIKAADMQSINLLTAYIREHYDDDVLAEQNQSKKPKIK